MDRVEGPAEDAEGAGHDPARPVGHAPLPGLRLPLELGATDPDGVARRDPGAAQLGVDAEAGEVALEALGGLLDVEVGLGGDPLDALPAHPEDAVVLELDAEAVAHRLDAVDDDARRLGRLGQLGRVGEDLGDARPEVGEAVALRRRDGDRVDALGLARAAEGRPCLGGRRAGRSC